MVTRLLRDRAASDGRGQRVANIELFFDLVYVFAVTQLSDYLHEHVTVGGALRTALLLGMVWICWAYTTWATNWMDPDHLAVRLMLVALTFVSLAMSSALPDAFGDLGALVGGAYALSQIGRSLFMVLALRGHELRRNFERILAWTVISGVFAVAGGLAHGHARALLWVLAPGTDLLSGVAGFWTPGLGRSRTTDWTISGAHLAERCQAFMLIALGESIVVIGVTISGHPFTATYLLSFTVAFVGTVALWWIYFDRSAAAAATEIERSADPGRLGRSAYHFIHPVMVAGIIVVAAADRNLDRPSSVPSVPAAWLILGGPALFLAGHAAFKFTVWRMIPWSRLAGIIVLGLLGAAATSAPEIVLATCTMAVLVAVAAYDRISALATRS